MLQQDKENSPRIGLFWFSDDYSEIIRSEGEKEITDSDLQNTGRYDPIGVHAEYDMPKDCPRGRINYENDHFFRIWVGEDCLVKDEDLIRLVKNYYDLTKIDSSKFKVIRHYHWNTKI